MGVSRPDYDAVIVGGGFYGCCLALFLRSVTERLLLVEAGSGLMERASRVNQARVHTGFHYPRSFTTALRCRILQERFVRDFRHAIFDEFDMLYAIATRRSKVSAPRFARMFNALRVPFSVAPVRIQALFDRNLIAEVFSCREFAFDWTALRDGLRVRLDANGISPILDVSVDSVVSGPDRVVARLSSGREVTARTLFNVTYANVNHLAMRSGLEPVSLKHELTEVALVRPPPELERRAVTVMDGPFFSTMPYPSLGLYSLTHVRYTPHYSWIDSSPDLSPYQVADRLPRQSQWRHMVHDARRYMPCLAGIEYQSSLFDVKTVLIKNERDDGRPILMHKQTDGPHVISILGAKIDNIYDLFEILPQVNDSWRNAHAGLLFG